MYILETLSIYIALINIRVANKTRSNINVISIMLLKLLTCEILPFHLDQI